MAKLFTKSEQRRPMTRISNNRVRGADCGAVTMTVVSVGITNILMTMLASAAIHARMIRETRRAVDDGQERPVPDSARL